MKYKEKKVKINGEVFVANYIEDCDIPNWYFCFDENELRNILKE